jgi:Na+/melibiose symporter-like transporter
MMGWKKSVGYAVGDLGINLYFISSMTFLLYFYTDVLRSVPPLQPEYCWWRELSMR